MGITPYGMFVAITLSVWEVLGHHRAIGLERLLLEPSLDVGSGAMRPTSFGQLRWGVWFCIWWCAGMERRWNPRRPRDAARKCLGVA